MLKNIFKTMNHVNVETGVISRCREPESCQINEKYHSENEKTLVFLFRQEQYKNLSKEKWDLSLHDVMSMKEIELVNKIIKELEIVNFYGYPVAIANLHAKDRTIIENYLNENYSSSLVPFK